MKMLETGGNYKQNINCRELGKFGKDRTQNAKLCGSSPGANSRTAEATQRNCFTKQKRDSLILSMCVCYYNWKEDGFWNDWERWIL